MDLLATFRPIGGRSRRNCPEQQSSATKSSESHNVLTKQPYPPIHVHEQRVPVASQPPTLPKYTHSSAPAMSIISIRNVEFLNNPARFLDPYKFRVLFECMAPLPDGTQSPLVILQC